MPNSQDRFVVADRVSNPTYGLGTIKHVDGRYTTIAFDDHGTRKFVTTLVRLEHSDIPAPKRAGRTGSPKRSPPTT